MEVHTLTEYKTDAHFVSKVSDGHSVRGRAQQHLGHVLVRWSFTGAALEGGQEATTE